MSEEQRAFMVGDIARCYSCRSLLATRGASVRLAPNLVVRPGREPATGLQRYGLPRRWWKRTGGHAPGTPGFTPADIGDPGAIYVNCPNCDRGQVVRWPSRTRGDPPLP